MQRFEYFGGANTPNAPLVARLCLAVYLLQHKVTQMLQNVSSEEGSK